MLPAPCADIIFGGEMGRPSFAEAVKLPDRQPRHRRELRQRDERGARERAIGPAHLLDFRFDGDVQHG